MDNQGVESKLFSLEQLPHDFIATDLYDRRSKNFQQLLNDFIIPSDKFVFIVPEYNGSYPGVLKAFLDAVPPDLNRGKKVCIVGVASGRGGNIRGMEHLTGVLNYLGMAVFPNLLPISGVLNLIDDRGLITDENTVKLLEKQIREFIQW
jgi:NAD(P)H-dependent FMN reductase